MLEKMLKAYTKDGYIEIIFDYEFDSTLIRKESFERKINKQGHKQIEMYEIIDFKNTTTYILEELENYDVLIDVNEDLKTLLLKELEDYKHIEVYKNLIEDLKEL